MTNKFYTQTHNMKLGLSNGSSSNSKIVTITLGSFRIKVPEGTEGAESRKNKEGKVVFEKTFSELSGYLTGITSEETKYGKQVKFNIKADKDYTLSMGYADGLTTNLFKMLPNIDPTQPITLNVSRKMDATKGKEVTSLFVNQNEKPVKWFYTKADPNDMPPFEKIVVKGKEQWDNTKQLDFLWENAVGGYLAKLGTPKKDDGFQDFELNDDVEF